VGTWCCACKQQPSRQRPQVRTSMLISSLEVCHLTHSDVGCAGELVAGHGGRRWRPGQSYRSVVGHGGCR
jgi:hypothetical protein